MTGDGTWRASARPRSRRDGTSVYRLEGEDVAALMGSWNSSGGVFPEGMHRLDIPGLGRMLADLPILRASSASEIEDTFPAASG